MKKKRRFGVKINEKMKIFPKIFAQVESFYYFCAIFCKTVPVMGLFAIGIYIIDKVCIGH